MQERVRVLRARIRESVLPQPVDWREVFGDKILTLEVGISMCDKELSRFGEVGKRFI